MTLSRILVPVIMASVLLAAGCGRRPELLQTPTGAATERAKENNQPAPPEPPLDRRFILDPLI